MNEKNKETIKTILFLLLFLLMFQAGYVLGTMETTTKYKDVLKNNLLYCVFGDEIYNAPRTPKFNLTGVLNE